MTTSKSPSALGLEESTFHGKKYSLKILCPCLPCELVKASNGVNIGSRTAVVDVVMVATVIVVMEEIVVVEVEFCVCVNAPEIGKKKLLSRSCFFYHHYKNSCMPSSVRLFIGKENWTNY